MSRLAAAVSRSEAPIQRNAVHQATVKEVLAVDLNGREDSGQRAGRKDRLDQISGVEPVLTGLLNAGRHAFERHRQVLEGLRGQSFTQHAAKLTVAVQRRSAANDLGEAPKHRTVECSLVGQRVPERQQPLRAGRRGVRGQCGAVDRAH